MCVSHCSRWWGSIYHPLDLLELHGVIPTIVELGGAADSWPAIVCATSSLPPFCKYVGDAGRAEAVCRNLRLDAGGRGPALNHHVDDLDNTDWHAMAT